MNKKEEQFYGDRSDLLGRLIDYIKLCGELERDVAEELEEVLIEAVKETTTKLDISIVEE